MDDGVEVEIKDVCPDDRGGFYAIFYVNMEVFNWCEAHSIAVTFEENVTVGTKQIRDQQGNRLKILTQEDADDLKESKAVIKVNRFCRSGRRRLLRVLRAEML